MTKHESEVPTTESSVDTLDKVATAGAILKAAREKKGLSVESVAQQLHLRPQIVKDIEADKFDNIPSHTYARGYVRNYAKFIEADSAAIKACLDQQIPEYVPPTMQSFSRKTSRQKRDSRLNLVTYVIIAVLLAMVVLWWVQKTNSGLNTDIAQPTVEEIQAQAQVEESEFADLLEPQASSGVVTTAEPELEDEAQGVETNLPTTEQESESSQVTPTDGQEVIADIPSTSTPTPAQADTQSAPAVSQDTDTTSSPLADGQVRVQMTVKGDCWMSLVDVNGKVLIDGVKKAGHPVNVVGQAPLKLILGAPDVIELTVDNQTIDLSTYSGKVARLTLAKSE